MNNEQLTVVTTRTKKTIKQLEKLEMEYPDKCNFWMKEATGIVRYIVPESWLNIVPKEEKQK